MTLPEPASTSRPKTGGAKPHLPGLGVYGFDPFETVIFASLVTEDPLLLIGESGTGKTFLLNSLSEAMGLEHRHYNASLISFDDLVGFPYPDAEKEGVKFLKTPATVWGAESVLVDEISRCKPEHQNRLFSLVHERRVQGIRLGRLRFRWAAMNPCNSDQDPENGYAGSEALDPALADRFALIVGAADWRELKKADRARIADPSGEGLVADDGGWLRGQLAAWRAEFETRVRACPREIVDYAIAAATTLGSNGYRISPRRSRFLTRSLLAAEIVAGARDEGIYEKVLGCSLPHRAWGAAVDPLKVGAAHRSAWDSTLGSPERRWLEQFHLETKLAAKLELLLDECPAADTGTQAVCELLARETAERAVAFAYAVYPAVAQGAINVIGREGVNDLGKVAQPFLRTNGTISWQEPSSSSATTHPEVARFARVTMKLSGARRARAKQFFSGLLVAGLVPADPAALEEELDACVKLLQKRMKGRKAS